MKKLLLALLLLPLLSGCVPQVITPFELAAFSLPPLTSTLWL